ncbi:MAG TPA: hypothetical protein VNU94_06740 [Acidobacteriaceae bacterium]|jgi:hypothetical protein|nr:hypothetical protein [Acidobacteriaceae bacterium]
MNIWRMKLRAGDYGDDMWPQCRERAIASMTHPPIYDTDLSNSQKRDVPEAVRTAARTSIWRFAWDIVGGDVILVGDSLQRSIIARGFVDVAPGERAYRFNSVDPIVEPGNLEIAWRHEVPVKWDPDFVPFTYVDGAPRITVMHFDPSWAPHSLQVEPSDVSEDFLDDTAYRRETPASDRNIKRLHATLSNRFRAWLNNSHGIAAQQEKRRVDVGFSHNGKTHRAELKICYGGETRASIREALGQIFEYNLYPPRTSADSWLIVLDTKPSTEDIAYLEALRQQFQLPLSLVWATDNGFISDLSFLDQ